MNFKVILYLLYVLIVFISCYKPTEWEDVIVNYDPELNIIGIISLDEEIDTFIGVYRTTELSETSMIFSGEVDTISWYDEEQDTIYNYLDSLYEPSGVIDNAIVIIYTVHDSSVFEYDPNDKLYKNNSFLALEETEYKLKVEVDGFNNVRGQLITPAIPVIDKSLNDTIQFNSVYNINWINNQESAEFAYLNGELINSNVYCGGEFNDIVEIDSREYVVFPEWCNPDDITIGDIDNDYGYKTISECLCDNYKIWDQDNEICVCSNSNPPLLIDDDEAVDILGGCDQAIIELENGCNHILNNIPLYLYCPVSCGGCDYLSKNIENACSGELSMYCPLTCSLCEVHNTSPIVDRNWTSINIRSIDVFPNDFGYCGNGYPDYELINIRFMVMDNNYYKYFAQEEFKEFSNFLFQMDGSSGKSIGIEGGFGIFGAFASDTITRIISPEIK